MSAAKILIFLLVSFVLAVVVLGSCVYSGYSRAVTLDEEVDSKWAQVENQLQRRFDLIPNVVATVKGVAAQEEKIFLGVAEARKAYFQAKSVADKAQAAGTLQSALSRLLMLKETYPELKSNAAFLKLQDTVEGTENRLSTERRRYNETVKKLNVFVRKPLGGLYASLASVEKAEYFEMEEAAQERPSIDFSDQPASSSDAADAPPPAPAPSGS